MFIKLPFVTNRFVLSSFEWLFYTGFSVIKMPIRQSQLKIGFVKREFSEHAANYCSYFLKRSKHAIIIMCVILGIDTGTLQSDHINTILINFQRVNLY